MKCWAVKWRTVIWLHTIRATRKESIRMACEDPELGEPWPELVAKGASLVKVEVRKVKQPTGVQA